MSIWLIIFNFILRNEIQEWIFVLVALVVSVASWVLIVVDPLGLQVTFTPWELLFRSCLRVSHIVDCLETAGASVSKWRILLRISNSLRCSNGCNRCILCEFFCRLHLSRLVVRMHVLRFRFNLLKISVISCEPSILKLLDYFPIFLNKFLHFFIVV